MSLILIVFFTVSGIILGKILFKKWFNHLTVYCLIMGGLIFFYELKLLPYDDLKPDTWFLLTASYLCYLFGIITVFSFKSIQQTSNNYNKLNILNPNIYKEYTKVLKYSILFFSFIGLFVALHRWYVLVGKFGSIEEVLLNAAVVYRLNVQGEIKEFIPILPSFIYVGVFLSGIYTAIRGKFSFLSFFPLLTIILKELTYFGRGEMLFSSMEFLFTFLLLRHKLNNDGNKKFRFSKANAFVAAIILLTILISASSFIRISRGARESYVGTNRELNKLKDHFLFSPSVYLYISSDIGVFNKYLQLENENTRFGENTFRFFYDFLSRFEVTEKPKFFQKGYYIPMWVNTGTYLREIHADFGIIGVLTIPFLLGIILTWLWFVFVRTGNIYNLLFMVYFYLIIGFSFLMMITRLNQWYFSQVLILIYLPILQKIVNRKNSFKIGSNN